MARVDERALGQEVERRYSPGDVPGRNDFRDGAHWQAAQEDVPRHSPWFWPLIAFGALVAVVMAGTILSLYLAPAMP